jgi:hypothetical protein
MHRLFKLGFFLGVILMQVTSCKIKETEEDTTDHPEYLLFGLYQSPSNCFSGEACIEIYKIEPLGLFEDSNDDTPDSSFFYIGNFQRQLTNLRYEAIHDIFKDNIPQALLDRPSGSIGNPPTWTTNFYFEYKSEKIHKHWILDGSQQNVPSDLIPFINILSNASFTAGVN